MAFDGEVNQALAMNTTTAIRRTTTWRSDGNTHHVALRRQHPPRSAPPATPATQRSDGNTRPRRYAAAPPRRPRRHQPAVALLVSFVGRILAGGPLDAGHAPLLGLHDLGDALGGLAMEAVHEDAAL